MARYHINAKGNPFPCKARTRCPFGDLKKDHYDSLEEAQQAYEKLHANDAIPLARKKSWANYSLEDLQKTETAMLQEKLSTKAKLTDDEYDRHREYIRKVDAHYPSTHKQHTERIKGKTVYKAKRLALHDELIKDLEEKHSHVPTEGKVIISGGMPGAGKTTFLRKIHGKELENYAIINPDDVKEEMVKRGLAPSIPGLLPLETNSMIHYEANIITEKYYEKMREQGKNLVIDKTMATEGPMKKELDALKASGYKEFSALFVDVDPDVAYDRIINRHRAGIDEYIESGGKTLGERSVKGTIVSSARTENPNFYSKNSEVFETLKKEGYFTSDQYFDNNMYD